MNNQKLFVSDIFKSIQGEGAKIGTPSLFLRLGICNLQCTWCDTPYTWKQGFTDYIARSDEWIIEQLQSLHKGTSIKNIVITGGEPLLQQQQLTRLLKHEFFQNLEIEFETNGSQPLSADIPNNQKISFNISPKLEDSGNKPYKVHLYPNAVLKFVYVNKNSETLIDNFLQENLLKSNKNTPQTPIYIMPEGTTLAKMAEKYEDALSYCIKRGYKFTPRLHIYLFGNQRAT